jgi:hypothetical protein
MFQESVDRIRMIPNRHGRERKAWNPDAALRLLADKDACDAGAKTREIRALCVSVVNYRTGF